MKILIVEDDGEKLRRVLSCLHSVPGCDSDRIDIARDTVSAKRFLMEKQYDLLILDIALPERPDVAPKRDGGISFLDEILDRDLYKKPREIIGLTGYVEILEEAGARFREDLWSIIHYDPASVIWTEQLAKKVKYILSADRSLTKTVPDYSTDVCIVTALAVPELSEVLRLPWNWEELQLPNDATTYHKGSFQRDGSSKQVIAAASPRMGMPAAAILSMKMVATFRPRYLAMVGILAGVRGRAELGDIIAIDPGWDYGSGKWVTIEEKSTFEPAPHQLHLNSFIRSKLSSMSRDQATLDEIRRNWRGGGSAPKHSPSLLMGPVASGAAVLENSELMSLIRQQHRKLVGVEMEAYGVLAAAEESDLPQPKAFALKSVCDYADSLKNDDYQQYAAYTSSAALQIFLERFL